MLLSGKDNLGDVNERDIDSFIYAPVEDDDLWKIAMVKELIDVREGQYQIDNLTEEELEDILEYLCTI